MNTQVGQPKYIPTLNAGVAIVLLIGAGIVAMIVWFPVLTSSSGVVLMLRNLLAAEANAPIPSGQTAQRRARARALVDGSCAECGVIISIREAAKRHNDLGIGGGGGMTRDLVGQTHEKSIMQFEMNVLMADGSNRVFSQPTPGSWRPGQQVILIGGTEITRK